MELTTRHLERIRACFPDLVISDVEVNTEGLINDVLIVNGERVFRFPKDDGARESQRKEIAIVDLVTQHVDLRLPRFDHRADDLVSYRRIPGAALLRNDILRQDEPARDRIAQKLATFLRQLHAIPLEEVRRHNVAASDAARSRQDWLDFFENVQRELFPLLMKHAQDWVIAHFQPVVEDEAFTLHPPALIHGDLGPYHILWDRDAHDINGVIDFGTAGIGDPATDFGCIINYYGETFLRRMAKFYPEIGDAIDRARFWAGTLELQWALGGVRTGDLSWFTVHIGAARDVMPVGSPWSTASVRADELKT